MLLERFLLLNHDTNCCCLQTKRTSYPLATAGLYLWVLAHHHHHRNQSSARLPLHFPGIHNDTTHILVFLTLAARARATAMFAVFEALGDFDWPKKFFIFFHNSAAIIKKRRHFSVVT